MMPKGNAGVTSAKDADRTAHYHAHVYYVPATTRSRAVHAAWFGQSLPLKLSMFENTPARQIMACAP
jgi:aromatic ring-cleaving dioxygenase